MSKKIFSLLLVLVMLVGCFAGCGLFKKDEPETPDTPKSYTYNTYLNLSPSNWNELTYKDSNDTEIMSWIGSSFFTFDFKYDAEGNILPGEFETEYSAATKLEDVSAEVDAKWGIPEGASSYAYRITLRDDLKWENGDKIVAGDFVYTMSEQLNPLFQNYRANSFYVGGTILVNAELYLKQGSTQWTAATIYVNYSEDLDSDLIFSLAAPVSADEEKGIEAKPENYMRTLMGFPASYDAVACANYLITNYLSGSAFTLEAAAAMEGKTLAEIKADPTLAAAWADLIGWWQTEPDEELHFFISNYVFPEMDFSEVGIYAESDTELVIVLAKALPLLKEDGSLDYKAAYNMSSLPLVHKATYEANKVAPTEGSKLWTSTYNSSKETTMSWGPYKLESFQSGGQFTLVKNDNWYGYNMPENAGLYQTTKIVYDIVADWNAAWVKFQAGELDGVSIDVSIADDYKASAQAYFTPSDFVSSLQLQSSVEALAARSTPDANKMLLAYPEFRQALSLGINRAEFTATCTTSSKAGFGLYNSMHYYDVANGGVFRNTDEAKKVLCEVYGIDTTMYADLDAAVNAITGYNLTLARELVETAYAKALADGVITDTDTVALVFGTGKIAESVTRQFNYIKNAWEELVKGTSLEGRLVLTLEDKGTTWSDDFRAGAYDVCMGGWQGAAWDPGYFLLAYLDPSLMYSAAWDTNAQMMTFTMVGVAEDGGDITETMSLMDWYDCLNGSEGAKYDWSSAALEEEQRLQLIAALEKEVLTAYYTVPLANSFSASLISYQVDYVTYEYNTFMKYGGIKYMKYNYDDAAWAAAVAEQNNELNYK